MTMGRVKDIINKLRDNKYVNKYSVTLVAFAIWILIFDANSVINRIETYKRRREVEKKIEQYRQEIEVNNAILEALNSDTETLERFAREHYKMKKQNEDVYIINE